MELQVTAATRCFNRLPPDKRACAIAREAESGIRWVGQWVQRGPQGGSGRCVKAAPSSPDPQKRPLAREWQHLLYRTDRPIHYRTDWPIHSRPAASTVRFSVSIFETKK